jgi:hypothetical protein
MKNPYNNFIYTPFAIFFQSRTFKKKNYLKYGAKSAPQHDLNFDFETSHKNFSSKN